MNNPLTTESQLLPDIERLREQYPHTQDLYREVCTLLFFRHGVTPTANKLYQLVRKGSMTAPAEALAKFWEDLREKSRIRIEHPDLPDQLKIAAGELTATLWQAAQGFANESLAGYVSQAQATVIEAKNNLASAHAERNAAQEALQQSRHAVASANERIAVLEQSLAAAAATNAALELQAQQARDANVVSQQRLDDARRDFAAELDKLRSAAQLAEERYRAAETRALLEVDRERVNAAKLQKEIETVRAAAAQAADRHHSEQASVQAQVGDLRQKAGVLEGNLQAAAVSRDEMLKHIAELEVRLADAATLATTTRAEAESWKKKAERAQQLIIELRQFPKPTRAPHKFGKD